jgi:hypothetical protein
MELKCKPFEEWNRMKQREEQKSLSEVNICADYGSLLVAVSLLTKKD